MFALLVLNTGIYVGSGTLGEGIDSMAWLMLLALFQWETGSRQVVRPRATLAAIHGVRMACLAAIGGAAAGFLYNNEWLDAANSGLWIAVVVLLEVGVRRPAAVATHRARFAAAAAMLYAGLGAVALVWAWRGDWFDAYDAALWLVAFATIEMNVFETARRAGRERGSAGTFT
ncbi:MAG: hypothetical protein ACREUB_11755 [Burkholderiales bacterium]